MEIAEDLSVERIREDAFTGTPGPQSDLLFDVMRSSLVYPLDDQIVKFSNSTQVKTLVEDVKLHYGKDASGEEGASPKATHDWGDPTTNEHFSRFFFHGIGASLLEKQMGPSTQPDLGPIEIDLSFMAGLEVRKGFRPYGAKIYFDDKQKVQAIYDSHKETLVRPGDKAWQSTIFLAKSILGLHSLYCKRTFTQFPSHRIELLSPLIDQEPSTKSPYSSLDEHFYVQYKPRQLYFF